MIPCPHCKKSKYCSLKCQSLDWYLSYYKLIPILIFFSNYLKKSDSLKIREAWHKFSCPESLSNQGSIKSKLSDLPLSHKMDDFEILDFNLFPNNVKPQIFSEKYRDEYLVVREKKSYESFLMKIVFFPHKIPLLSFMLTF